MCHYPGSRIAFRGPVRALDRPYVAVLGGSETFGKFVAAPFPDLLEARLDQPVVNLGVMHAGLSLFLDDPAVLQIASGADLTIVQLFGAQNMSNRYYSVHPRRNDRFLSASPRLQALYPDTDFTEFNFTGHLLAALEARGPDVFEMVITELRTAWVNRMSTFLSAVQGECLLLWMSDRQPGEVGKSTEDAEPMFVTRAMIDALVPIASGLVEKVASPRARVEGLDSRGYLPGEEAAARALPGPRFHAEVADALAEAILGDVRAARARH